MTQVLALRKPGAWQAFTLAVTPFCSQLVLYLFLASLPSRHNENPTISLQTWGIWHSNLPFAGTNLQANLNDGSSH